MFQVTGAIWVKRMAFLVMLGLFVALMASRFFDSARTARQDMLENHHARMRSLNAQLLRHNAQLESELKSLDEGEEGWARVARRTQSMLLPGEVIFRFPTESN